MISKGSCDSNDWRNWHKNSALHLVAILDFWGPYAKLCRWGGGGGKNGLNAFVRVSLHLELRSRKSAREQSLPWLGTLSTNFFCFVFFSNKRLYSIHVTWVDWFLLREGDSVPHWNKLSFVFHNHWPNSKIKLKLKHLWEHSLRILRIRMIGSVCITGINYMFKYILKKTAILHSKNITEYFTVFFIK